MWPWQFVVKPSICSVSDFHDIFLEFSSSSFCAWRLSVVSCFIKRKINIISVQNTKVWKLEFCWIWYIIEFCGFISIFWVTKNFDIYPFWMVFDNNEIHQVLIINDLFWEKRTFLLNQSESYILYFNFFRPKICTLLVIITFNIIVDHLQR